MSEALLRAKNLPSFQPQVQVHKPKEWKPELAASAQGSAAQSGLTREQKMMQALGLQQDLLEDNSDEEDGQLESDVSKDVIIRQLKEERRARAEIEKELKEMKKHLDSGSERSALLDQKHAEQLTTIKKLADSRVAIMTKNFQEKLSLKEQEIEEGQVQAAAELEKADALRRRVTLLEAKMKEAGIDPPAQSTTDAEAMDRSDVERRLQRKIQRQKEESAQMRAALEQKEQQVASLQVQAQSAAALAAAAPPAPTQHTPNASADGLSQENSNLKKTVDNLMEANTKLAANTKSKIAFLEKELEKHRSGAAGSAPSAAPAATAGGVDGAVVEKLQQNAARLQSMLKEGEKALSDKDAELAALREQLNQLRQNMASGESGAKVQAQLQGEVTKLQQSLKKEKDAAEKGMAKLKELMTAHASCAGTIDKLQKEKAALTGKQQQQYQELKKTVATTVKKQQQQIVELKTAFLQLRKEAQAAQSDIFPTIKAFYGGVRKRLEAQQTALAGASEKYLAEVKERKRLFNLVQELKGNIRVYCRVRPLLPHELERGETNIVTFPAEGELSLYDDVKMAGRLFEFEKVFQPHNQQVDIFNELEGLITSVLDGYNVCIFAYGQTGSGKTFTMEGNRENRGVNPRAMDRLFDLSRERAGDIEYQIFFCILEIYNEEIHDLLADYKKKLEVRQGPNGNFVQDCTLTEVHSVEEVLALWKRGSLNRASASNNVNEHSSRSHLVLQFQIEALNHITGVRTRSKLNLIDLAGSERVGRTHSEGERLKEAQAINKSLSSLGDVIAALGSKSAHIPYRNSKLTHLLQDSLSGDSKTLMIVQVGPGKIDLPETTCSLNFASRVRAVELGQAKVNKVGGGPAPPSGPTTGRPKTARG
mmetsp:Transcript_88/g.270  ORF Transcript_88/g.270 Transcript_88/m.270 type:complete len:878 (-) Transcript_88:200-2833(-)